MACPVMQSTRHAMDVALAGPDNDFAKRLITNLVLTTIQTFNYHHIVLAMTQVTLDPGTSPIGFPQRGRVDCMYSCFQSSRANHVLIQCTCFEHILPEHETPKQVF